MRCFVSATLLLVGACDRAERPEAPTAAENAQLDDAEAMLNEMGNEETQTGVQ